MCALATLDAFGATPVFGAVGQRHCCEDLGGVRGHPSGRIGPELEEDQHRHIVSPGVGTTLVTGSGQASGGNEDPFAEAMGVVVGGSSEVMCQVGLLFSGQRPPPVLVGRVEV
jgi:hypothetical protein